MSGVADLALALVQGGRLALEFNPAAAVVAAGAAGLIAGTPRASKRHTWWAAAVVLGCWTLGDGPAVAGLLSSIAGSVAATAGPVMQLVGWAVGGLCLGYLAPAIVGVSVGRRVVFGTARFAGAVTGSTIALTISALAGALSG